MNEDVAALLWTVAAEKRWLITAAVPRKAGKSTVLEAALRHVPARTPLHRLDGSLEEIRRLGRSPDGGYLVVGEISTEPPPRYIWGEKVAALFETLRAGFSLATTMHANGVEDVFKQICTDNGIGDQDASRIQYVVVIERTGDRDESYRRHVVSVHEIEVVKGGKPSARLLFRRTEAGRIETVDRPRLLAASAADLLRRARLIQRQAGRI